MMNPAPENIPHQAKPDVEIFLDRVKPKLESLGVFPGRASTLVPFGGDICGADAERRSSIKIPNYRNYLDQSVGVSRFSFTSHYPKDEKAALAETFLKQDDSTHLIKQDLEELIETISKMDTDLVIVPTGLHKIVDFARYVEANLPENCQNKLIIFTGSRHFFSDCPGDAKYTLGNALSHRHSNRQGVFISLNNRLERPDAVLVMDKDPCFSYMDRGQDDMLSPTDFSTLIIGCGGTIEGQETDVGSLYSQGFCENYIRNVIHPKQVPIFANVAVRKDSSQLTEEDLIKLESTIKSADSTNIVVTIGTKKAEEVLEQLAEQPGFLEHLRDSGKKVIFACSMELPNQQDSDAFFNLGMALGSAQYMEPGLYLCVHGVIAAQGALQKNYFKNDPRRKPRFELTNAI